MTVPFGATYAAHVDLLTARHRTATVLLAPGRAPLTFGMLHARIDAMRTQLAGWNIGPGDVVAWPAVDRVATAAAIAAVPACATLMPLPAALTASAYARVLARVKAKAVVAPLGIAHPIVDAARQEGIAEIGLGVGDTGDAAAFGLALVRDAASLARSATLAPDTLYVALTSGTTGKPKLVPQGWTSIAVTSSALGRTLSMGPDDVSAHLTTLHLANGLRTATMLAILNGGAVNVLPEGDLDAFRGAIAAGEVTYTSSTFTMHRELLRRLEGAPVAERGRLRFLRVASGRLEAEEMDRLETAFGVPVVTGLSTSETGTIAMQRLPPARRTRGSVGSAVASEIRIADEHGAALPPGAVGEVQVRGPQVFDGYLDDPELNATAFVDGWFRLGDLGRFDEHGDLHLVGRVKDTINRGGEKIAPQEIDAVLQALPGVIDAAAFGTPHPSLGEEVVAAVVRARGSALDAEQVMAAVRAELGERRAPRTVWFVDALPRTEGGKLRRTALAELVQRDAATPAATRSRAATPLEMALSALWTDTLRRAPIGLDENYFMLGGDSLRGAKLLTQVNAAFGVDLPVQALFDAANTIAGMARSIERARGEP